MPFFMRFERGILLGPDVYARDVFTPSLPATLTFVERNSIDDRLVRALQTPGKQLVVFGHSGAGKTTLISTKLPLIFERHITTRCTSGMTFEQVVLNGFDQLAPFYERDIQTTRGRTVNAGIKADYLAIKSEIGASKSHSTATTSTRALPPQLTAQLLAQLMGEANACWVIEDFHKVADEEKARLAQTMKVFMDAAAEYPDVKIIAIGAVGTGREVIRLDREMAGRVSEVHVPLMDDDELRQIIDRGSRLLNLEFDQHVATKIVALSSGLPIICHQLCLNICFSLHLMKAAQQPVRVEKQELEAAMKMYVEEVSDSLKERFDKAARAKRKSKFDNCRIVLKALCTFDHDGATYRQLLTNIHRTEPEYPPSNLTTYLRELKTAERGEVISLDEASGRFYFTDPFIRALCQARMGVQPAGRGWSQLMKLVISDDGSLELVPAG